MVSDASKPVYTVWPEPCAERGLLILHFQGGNVCRNSENVQYQKVLLVHGFWPYRVTDIRNPYGDPTSFGADVIAADQFIGFRKWCMQKTCWSAHVKGMHEGCVCIFAPLCPSIVSIVTMGMWWEKIQCWALPPARLITTADKTCGLIGFRVSWTRRRRR